MTSTRVLFSLRETNTLAACCPPRTGAEPLIRPDAGVTLRRVMD